MNPPRPSPPQFPTGALLLFNFADWGGILTSVLLIDRLGRRGFFTLGFTTAALLWIALGLVRPISGQGADSEAPGLTAVLLIFGSLASATRGFAPEAANLWVLETFATEQRATCYATVNIGYQITASIVVPLGGFLVDRTQYAPTEPIPPHPQAVCSHHQNPCRWMADTTPPNSSSVTGASSSPSARTRASSPTRQPTRTCRTLHPTVTPPPPSCGRWPSTSRGRERVLSDDGTCTCVTKDVRRHPQRRHRCS